MEALSEPVLLLNANYEPLNVCSTRRAVNLWLSGKAEMLLNGRGVIRTVRREIPRPSVIRLSYMIKRPYPRVRLSKKEIFRRDQYRCQYCGQEKAQLTLDHVIPRHQGGEYSWTNLVTACPSCNLKKGGRTIKQANMRLLRKPMEPRATASYLYGGYIKNNSEWEQFLRGW
jgi:5-methylcytosine-specific restriction endonuclease McrA